MYSIQTFLDKLKFKMRKTLYQVQDEITAISLMKIYKIFEAPGT